MNNGSIDIRNSTILLVDDNPSNLAALYSYLRRREFNILTCESGREALNLLKEIEPDLILLDILMPEMDGYEVGRRIKENPKFEDLPIIFLSAVGSTEDKLKGFEAGGVDYITKPFTHSELGARVNAQLMIRHQKKKLTELNRFLEREIERKDRLFSIISHDIRSPLSTILGYSEILIEDIDELDKPDILSYSSYINNVAREINSLMTNLLDWSRLQLDKVDFTPTIVKVKELVDESVRLLHDAAEKKKINIITNYDNGAKILADENMISTVIRNLISNSIKFTERGGTIDISVHSAEDSVFISVSDTGIGIPVNDVEKLFEVDGKSSRPGTEQEKGTGLGLILCKEFVNKNKGTIFVESIPGNGSCFTIKLPVA